MSETKDNVKMISDGMLTAENLKLLEEKMDLEHVKLIALLSYDRVTQILAREVLRLNGIILQPEEPEPPRYA